MSDSKSQIEEESQQERTLIIIKPDAVQRGRVGPIISEIQKLGVKLFKLEMRWPRKQIFSRHYGKHSDQHYFEGLLNYMTSGPIVVVVWQGPNAVKSVRKKVAGLEDTLSCKTIRGQFAPLSNHFITQGDNTILVRNVCHASDDLQEAERQIKLWFPKQNQ